MSVDALDAIFARRSIGRLEPPAPMDADLLTILKAAAAAPDHLELRPLRLLILVGDAKKRFGDVLADAYEARCSAGNVTVVPAKLEKERTKLGRAPMVIVVAAADTTEGRIPFSEQQAGAAAAAQNALLAATALGYGAMWRTGDPAYDPMVKKALGLDDADAIAGFLYVGTIPAERGLPPRDPELDGIVTTWSP
ncbi:MAG: nitroreductase family protein [Acidimicrobiales bacterium]